MEKEYSLATRETLQFITTKKDKPENDSWHNMSLAIRAYRS